MKSLDQIHHNQQPQTFAHAMAMAAYRQSQDQTKPKPLSQRLDEVVAANKPVDPVKFRQGDNHLLDVTIQLNDLKHMMLQDPNCNQIYLDAVTRIQTNLVLARKRLVSSL